MAKKHFVNYQQIPKIDDVEVLDTQLLLERCENSIGEAEEQIRTFLDSNDRDLPELERALSCGDIARVASMAYRIRQIAESLGAVQTCLVTSELEKSCRRGTSETLPLHISQLRYSQKALHSAIANFSSDIKHA